MTSPPQDQAAGQSDVQGGVLKGEHEDRGTPRGAAKKIRKCLNDARRCVPADEENTAGVVRGAITSLPFSPLFVESNGFYPDFLLALLRKVLGVLPVRIRKSEDKPSQAAAHQPCFCAMHLWGFGTGLRGHGQIFSMNTGVLAWLNRPRQWLPEPIEGDLAQLLDLHR